MIAVKVKRHSRKRKNGVSVVRNHSRKKAAKATRKKGVKPGGKKTIGYNGKLYGYLSNSGIPHPQGVRGLNDGFGKGDYPDSFDEEKYLRSKRRKKR